MVIDGKVSGQPCKRRFNSGDPKPTCDRCNTLLDNPLDCGAKIGKSWINLYSYMYTNQYIYETKSGWSVIYCSKKCRDLHNHRFNKQPTKQPTKQKSRWEGTQIDINQAALSIHMLRNKEHELESLKLSNMV